jgi:hypothetical protein
MASSVVESEAKTFTFTEGNTTATKKYSGPLAFSVTIQYLNGVFSLSSGDFSNFYDVVVAAYNQKYEPDYGPTGSQF